MARFLNAKYETDGGEVRPIRVRPATVTQINPAASATATSSVFVRAGGSRRQYGMVAREITISKEIGNSAAVLGSATVSTTIPILTRNAFNAIAVGNAYTYNGETTWYVSAKREESER